MDLVGRQFGHIRVTGVVGQGGMGDVYGGYDEKLERKVALKVLNADQRLDDEARERLLREARALSKLDHPNICRIHDYIESGEVDLLVLEYIDGVTLGDALGEKTSRSEKLRIAIAIAEVLVQAHRARIVHRDLKPENVMLTKTGEVKVLDFGLARWLNRTKKASTERQAAARLNVRTSALAGTDETMVLQPNDTPSPSPSGRPFLATAVGITLGTPLFMSPEQARGESLTPASDMFSFGLVLQSLFTGKDPHPIDLTAREVILRVARGQTLPVEGAPGDVTALILRLKQLAPADRPTAVETVERLKLLADKPRRIARRTVVAALVLVAVTGAWRYTVDLQHERALAVAARKEADTRRAQAEDLIEFMLGDLRKKLEPVGRLEILDDVGERALSYVGSLQLETMSAQELARSSKALNQLVEVRIAQGNLQGALALAARSLRLTEVAVKRAPNDPEVQLAYGTSHFWVGNVHRLLGDLPRALERMKMYSAVTDRLARQYPTNETYQLERAYGHSVVATILESQGDLRSALQEYYSTREVKAARVAAKPTDFDRQADLALTLNKIGFVLLRSSDLEGARDHFARELAIYQRLATDDPLNRKWQDLLARSHGFNAASAELAGQVTEAIAHVHRELQILSALHTFDLANALWARDLAMTNLHLSSLLVSRGEVSGALAAATAGEKLMRDLLQKDAKSSAWHRELALLLIARARAQFSAGSYAAARTSLHAVESELRLTNDTRLTARTRAEAGLVLGDVLRATGQEGEARNTWSEAAQAVALLSNLSADPNLQALYARLLLRLGRLDEATPLLQRLASVGYRQPDLTKEQQLVLRPTTQRSSLDVAQGSEQGQSQ
jgi:serine/threonine-protein kinase